MQCNFQKEINTSEIRSHFLTLITIDLFTIEIYLINKNKSIIVIAQYVTRIYSLLECQLLKSWFYFLFFNLSMPFIELSQFGIIQKLYRFSAKWITFVIFHIFCSTISFLIFKLFYFREWNWTSNQPGFIL